MDSYFLAETLKYLYLLFSPNHWMRKQPHVFNTEGHPLPVLALMQNGSGANVHTFLYPNQKPAPGGEEAEANRGACARPDFRRRIAAYGFDLLAGEILLQAQIGDKATGGVIKIGSQLSHSASTDQTL
ncbi:hypothetical protein T484DRAFT_1783856 [Baffinella frigidus]|nr:hypothetical protein T484DRAFT_1783856 [Cryptophyta sp. CCMP2293]